jgi:hypothetical protein
MDRVTWYSKNCLRSTDSKTDGVPPSQGKTVIAAAGLLLSLLRVHHGGRWARDAGGTAGRDLYFRERNYCQ